MFLISEYQDIKLQEIYQKRIRSQRRRQSTHFNYNMEHYEEDQEDQDNQEHVEDQITRKDTEYPL